MICFLLGNSQKTTASLPAMPPGEYVRQERRAGGTGTSRSEREAREAPAMPLATLTNTGIGPTIGPRNKEWASKLGKLGKCSEINIKLCIINLSSNIFMYVLYLHIL